MRWRYAPISGILVLTNSHGSFPSPYPVRVFLFREPVRTIADIHGSAPDLIFPGFPPRSDCAESCSFASSKYCTAATANPTNGRILDQGKTPNDTCYPQFMNPPGRLPFKGCTIWEYAVCDVSNPYVAAKAPHTPVSTHHCNIASKNVSHCRRFDCVREINVARSHPMNLWRYSAKQHQVRRHVTKVVITPPRSSVSGK